MTYDTDTGRQVTVNSSVIQSFSVVDEQKLKKPKKWKNKEEERQILPSGQQGENSAKSWLFRLHSKY